MKFAQLLEYSHKNIFRLKNHPENEAGKLVPELVLCFQKMRKI